VHELGIAQNIIRIIEGELVRHGGGRVVKVRLRIGEWSGVEPESLTFCYDASIAQTMLEGSCLEIEHVPLRCHCPECNKEFSPERFSRACPDCGETRTEMVNGTELEIVDFEVK